MPHPALAPNNVAVITGGASGIGLAAAMRFARLGLRICIADVGADKLAQAATQLTAAAPQRAASVMTAVTDVGNFDEVTRLEAAVRERFGGTDVLMNNAGIQPGSKMFGPTENWRRILDVNLWGVINGCQVFAPGMIERGRPGLIINTGSKQGITTPPGDPAYNVSKAGVKALPKRCNTNCAMPPVRAERASVDPGLCVYRPHLAGTYRKTGGSLDPRTDGRFHDRAGQRRRLLHSMPGQRRAARPRRAANSLGRGRYRRKPASAVAVASRFRKGFFGVCGREIAVRRSLTHLCYAPYNAGSRLKARPCQFEIARIAPAAVLARNFAIEAERGDVVDGGGVPAEMLRQQFAT